ncbi:hypothetical protein D3C73_1184740 [compost metagenome]
MHTSLTDSEQAAHPFLRNFTLIQHFCRKSVTSGNLYSSCRKRRRCQQITGKVRQITGQIRRFSKSQPACNPLIPTALCGFLRRLRQLKLDRSEPFVGRLLLLVMLSAVSAQHQALCECLCRICSLY